MTPRTIPICAFDEGALNYGLCDTAFFDLTGSYKIPPDTDDIEILTLDQGMNSHYIEPWFECEVL